MGGDCIGEMLVSKILLFGANGQVGQALMKRLSSQAVLIPCDRSVVDLNDLDSLEKLITKVSPEYIINAAAYTAVDRAETDASNVFRINKDAPHIMGKMAEKLKAWLIHYSTDYVFDGEKNEPYLESDSVNPLNVYGQSKAEGEQAIRDSGCKHVILRTSWVYSQDGHNFLKTMVKLSQTKDLLKIVSDQMGAPTSTDLIAHITSIVLKNPCQGTYHLSARGETSWLEFADLIFRTREISTQTEGILSQDYPSLAKRPKNSRLNTDKLCAQFNVTLPPWEVDAQRIAKELIA